MRLQPLMGCVLVCIVVGAVCSECWAWGWRRVRCCARQPVPCCVTYMPVCGFAPAYPLDGRIVEDRTAPPPPTRSESAAQDGRGTELLRGEADADPPPPPPESTGVPAQAPQPTLSPRDIQPLESQESEEPEEPAALDDSAAEDAATDDDLGRILGAEPEEPAEPAESAAAPGSDEPAGDTAPTPDAPPEQPAEATELRDLDEPANPFDSSSLDALPTLMPGGMWSRHFRGWVDRDGQTRFKGRLIEIGDGAVRLMKDDGTITELAIERLSRRDAAFVGVQVRALASTGVVAAAKEVEDAPRGLLAASHARGNADAPVRVTR